LGCNRIILYAQNKVSVLSPVGQIAFLFKLDSGHPEYSVKYKNKNLIENSIVSRTFISNDFFSSDNETGHITISERMDVYILPEGKTSKVYHTYTFKPG